MGNSRVYHLTVRLLEQPFSAQHSRKGTTCSNHAGEWLTPERPALQLATTLQPQTEQGAANAAASLDHMTLSITSNARNNKRDGLTYLHVIWLTYLHVK